MKNTWTKQLFGTLLVAALTASIFETARADVRDGLVSYWPLDVDSGNGTTPDVGSVNNISIVNGATTTNGMFGNAFAFSVVSSVSKYLTLTQTTNANATGLPVFYAPGGYTVTFWVKGAAQTAHYLFTESSATLANPLLLIQTGNAAGANSKLDVAVRNDAGTFILNHVASSNVVFNNVYHHIAWVDNHGVAKLYVDGQQDGSNYNYTLSGTITLDTTSIGQLVRNTFSAAAGFTGSIDDVAVWERTLSQAEIQSVMASSIPTPVNPAAPVMDRVPVSLTNAMGDRAVFASGAYGTHPLFYQWYQDGNPVANQTNATLILTALTNSGTFNYTLVASNAVNVASNSATLTVLPDAAPNVTSGLVSYWPLDAVNVAATTTSPDIYYQHDDFTLTNMSSGNLVAGQFTNALNFNGVNQYGLRTGGSPIYPVTNYTISFWLNGNSGQVNKQIFAEGDTSGSFFLMGTENNTPAGGSLSIKSSVAATGLTDRKSSRPVLDGSWHHIVWVDQNGNAKLYVDGVLDETDYAYTRTNLTLSVTCIGALFRSSAANFFAGSLDEVATWNRRLSYTEIQQIHTNSIPQPSLAPPVITQPPLSSTNRLGDRVTLSVVATGTAPLTYQWYQNGVSLGGQTNSTLPLQYITPITNQYYVAITNPAIGITSGVVTVTYPPDPAANVSSNLLYYWPMNTVTASNTTPDTYSGDDLALLGGLDLNALVGGEFGQALLFNGSSYYAQRAGGYPAYLTTNYSVSFWVNGPPGQVNKIVYGEGGAGGNYFLMGTENSAPFGGSLNIKVNPGMNDRKSTRTVFDSTWHHVVWTDTNGKGRLYIDGALDETDFSYTRGNLTLESSAVGALVRTSPLLFFSGTVDDVSDWSRVLSYTEISQIYASSIPALVTPVAPSFFRQPAVNTNLVFAGDSVSISALVSGTGPVSLQWLKNGSPVDGNANPSALSNVLLLANTTTNDTASYSLQASNAVTTVISSNAALTVIPYVKVTNGVALRLDFDPTNVVNVQPGFSEMTLIPASTNFGGVTVTISSLGGAPLSDRDRSTLQNAVSNNPPFLTQAQLYNDVIFANDATNGTGLRILIERLATNTTYGLTVWSYDAGSATPRYSDWTETSSGSPITIASAYSFDANVPPTTDYDDTFGALLTSSATGKLQIEGVKNASSGAQLGVFVNGLQLVANPVIQIVNVANGPGGTIQMVVQTQYPNQPIVFQESPNLSPGSWQTAVDGTYTTHGLFVVAVFPASSTQQFYRVMKQ